MSQNFADFTEGILQSALNTSATTGVTVKLKKINGGFPTWVTGAHQIMIVQKTRTQTKVEKLNVASGTTQTAVGIVTLGTLTRKISLTDGTDTSGTGTAQSFTQSAAVYIAWTTTDAEQTVKKEETNTLTGDGAIRSSSTTTPVVRLNNVTTTQRDAMTAANGDKIYNTTTGTEQTFKGGAWTDVGDTGTPDGSTTVAGKFEEATVAEQGAATATGESGARLVPANANIVKTSSGAGDENKLVVPGSAGTLDINFLATGTPDGTKFVRDDGTLVTPTFSGVTTFIGSVTAASSAVGSASTAENAMSPTFTGTNSIGAGTLAAGDVIHVRFSGNYRLDSGTLTVLMKVGGVDTSVVVGTFPVNTTTEQYDVDIYVNTRSIGATGKIYAGTTASTQLDRAGTGRSSAIGEATVDTTGALAITFTAQYSASDAQHAITIQAGVITITNAT